MYTLKPMTDRVKTTREKYRNTVPRVDISRYRLITEFYQSHPGMTGQILRASAMKYIYENMPLRVEDEDLIVGALGTTFRACSYYPEYGAGTLAREVKSGNISSRKYDPYTIDPEDGQYVMDTAAYWDQNSLGSKTNAYKMTGYLEHDGSSTTTQSAGHADGGPVGHLCTGYNRAIRKGFGAIKAEADAKMRQIEDEGAYGNSIEKYYFYQGISLVCEGMITFTKRYAKKVEEMAAAETRPARKAELEKMAENLNWVTENPARNFWEALQALFLYQICLALEGNMHGMSWGRLDQYLGDYYDRDIASGAITPEFGQELLDMFYLKVAEMNKFWGDSGEYGVPGYTSGQLITIGGVDPKTGEDATNAVTYMCLQASGRLVLHDPPTALRIHKGMPEDLWEAAIETNKICGGVPSMENDEVIIPALMDRGLPLESARNYCAVGCVEPGGCGDEWCACGGTGGGDFFNMVNALMVGINNGANPMPRRDWMTGKTLPPKQVGPATGYLKDYTSFDQVLDAYKQQVELFVKMHISLTNSFEYVARQHMPLPVVSSTMDGCMEKGADVMWGGARYNSTGIAGVGIGNLADSLQMIKHLCFDEKTKRCTPAELYDALMHNWEGHEDLYNYVNNEAPHYGNGDPEADAWVRWASDVFAEAVKKGVGLRGGGWSAGLWPVTTNVAFGLSTPATPDGRKMGEPLADGVSPRQQMDKNGPTGVLLSVGDIDYRQFANGTLLNMKFSPSCMNGADSIEKMTQLLKTYFFDMLGMEVQINIVSAETMRAAQKNPEEYKDLVVRIAGFSVYFVEMHRTGQNDLISRTELSL